MTREEVKELSEEISERYNEDAAQVLKDAVNLKRSLDDMLTIICLHLKHTADPLINEKAFVADGHNIGLEQIIPRLQLIWSELNKYSD